MPLSRQNSATDVVMGDWSIWVRCHPGVTKHDLPFISAEVGCPKTSGILPLVKEKHNDSSGLRSKTLGVLEHCGRNISKGKDSGCSSAATTCLPISRWRLWTPPTCGSQATLALCWRSCADSAGNQHCRFAAAFELAIKGGNNRFAHLMTKSRTICCRSGRKSSIAILGQALAAVACERQVGGVHKRHREIGKQVVAALEQPYCAPTPG
jgi:hypothetical protein